MLISYNIKISVTDLVSNAIITFEKGFHCELTLEDHLLYDNYHILDSGTYILSLFQKEIDDYCLSVGIGPNSILIEEYELQSLTDRVDVYFINPVDEATFTLSPAIKCYVYPKLNPLQPPVLKGEAYDSNTIIWSWDDVEHAHYLVDEPTDVLVPGSSHIIADLPIGRNNFIETNLEPNTAYGRRLISYTDTLLSPMSKELVVKTECVNPSKNLDQYFVEREEDFTVKKEDNIIIKDRLLAFHSGVGDGNDLKIYKQLDSDFYEKFKGYLELTGAYYQREKRYDQVGFNYKLCLEATETVEEQEGSVTYKVDCYPRQKVTVSQYLYGVRPLQVNTKIEALVTLQKEGAETASNSITVKKTDYAPTYTTITVEKFLSDTFYFNFAIDISGSMNWKEGGVYKIGNKNYMEVVMPAIKKTLESIENTLVDAYNKATNNGTSEINKDVDYIAYISFVLFSTNAQYWTNGFTAPFQIKGSLGAGQIKKIIAGLNKLYYKNASSTNKTNPWMFDPEVGYSSSNINDLRANKINRYYTNWDCAIDKSIALAKKLKVSKDNQINIFFSDGLPNTESVYTNGKITSYKFSGEGASSLLAQIKTNGKKLRDHYRDVYVVTLLQKKLSSGMLECVKEMTNNKNTTNLLECGEDETQIANAFASILSKCKGTTEIEIEDPKGSTETTTQKVTVNIPINKNDIKTVTIQTDPIPFIIDQTLTPVGYSYEEQRAKILQKMHDRKITEKSVLQLINEKIATVLAQNPGYTVMSAENGDPLISNLVIYDNFAYGDEDGWLAAEDYYDYALRGSINVYANRLGNVSTEDFSDDYYIISNDSYLFIGGYTDAIIYEGTRFATVEINAKNNPQATLFPGGMDARKLITNRKNKNIIFPGNMIDVTSVTSIVQQDEYVFITGDGLTTDMIAITMAHFVSPTLNYRFNLEDPDAFTPYYEILPASNPLSIDKNIIDITIYQADNVYVNNEYLTGFNVLNAKGEYDGTLGVALTRNLDYQLIDSYIHFLAKPMKKTRPYYAELPGDGIDSFYGLVNGRYQENNKSGKQNLVVQTPSFNIPSTVLEHHADTVKIFVKITEFYPDTALVAYKWLHEAGDGFTKTNGDMLTFSCDSLTYKDVEYKNIIGTYETDEMEMIDNPTKEVIFNIDKPIDTANKYDHYYLRVLTNNADILATKHPTEIVFDGNTSAIPVTFKGIVNATSKWSPRIHNGFYYLNQHEHFLYSEFEVGANFDKVTEAVYGNMDLFVSLSVSMTKNEGINESYSVLKDSVNELLQDEEKFIWEPEKGLTLRPAIEGFKYKHYQTTEYVSPVILFPNELTTITESLTLIADSNGLELNVLARYYDLELGMWTEWTTLWANPSTTPLSSGYQIKVTMSASEIHSPYEVTDYLCCYLDWKEEIMENASSNIVTVTDYITTDRSEIEGIFVSKIFDYACPTGMELEIYTSLSTVKCYAAYSNSQKDLVAEAAPWVPIEELNLNLQYRYYRYKIVIPGGQKVYWVKKTIKTLETEVTLPYLKSISMGGNYVSPDINDSFLNVESFQIPRDGKEYTVIPRILDYIESDVRNFGFELSHITKIDISSNLPDACLIYEPGLDAANPNPALLKGPIVAKAQASMIDLTTYYPFIFLQEGNKIVIDGTPQQYAPISVEDEHGITYLQLFDDDINENNLIHTDHFELTEVKRFLELKYNQYDLSTIKVVVNEKETTEFEVVNHLLLFKNYFQVGDKVDVSYAVPHSFYAKINRIENTTELTFYAAAGEVMPDKLKVKFETNLKNNKLRLDHLSLNPIYRSDYKGFLYLTDDINHPESMNIYCNPMRIKSGGMDKVDVIIELLDHLGNPVINRNVIIDLYATNNGEKVNAGSIENNQLFVTDVNGIIHFVYQSSLVPCIATIKATHIKEDYKEITKTIEITNY